jgi:hypothetical protein
MATSYTLRPRLKSCIDAAAVCSVCLEHSHDDTPEQHPSLTDCGHSVHGACLLPWLASHDTCPVCRKPLVIDVDMSWVHNAPDNTENATYNAIECPDYLGVGDSPVHFDDSFYNSSDDESSDDEPVTSGGADRPSGNTLNINVASGARLYMRYS